MIIRTARPRSSAGSRSGMMVTTRSMCGWPSRTAISPGRARFIFSGKEGGGEGPAPTASVRQDDGFARGLGIEEFIGFLGLIEPPAVGEQLVDGDFPLGDEFGAFGLALF